MAAEKTKKDIEIAEFAFNGVLFSVLGLLMLVSLNLQVRANFRFCLVTALPGLVVFAFSMRRCRRYWPGLAGGWRARSSWSLEKVLDWRAVLGAFGLFALGAMLGKLGISGSVTLLGIAAVAASVIPWWKIPFVHQSPPIAFLVVATGAIVPVLAAHTPWIHFATASWVNFLVAGFSAMTAAWREPSNSALAKEEAEEVPLVLR